MAACNQMMQQEKTTGGSSSPSSLATAYPPMEAAFPTRPHLMRIKRSFFVPRRERESTSGASAMIYQAENTQVPHLWWVFLGVFFFPFFDSRVCGWRRSRRRLRCVCLGFRQSLELSPPQNLNCILRASRQLAARRCPSSSAELQADELLLHLHGRREVFTSVL